MHDLDQTRQTLLLSLTQCGSGAWAEFLSVYEQAILRYCRAKGLQDADARDVTQDVLVAVYKRIDSWDHNPEKGSFRGWLFRVARNIAVDEIKRRRRRAIASGNFDVQELLQGAAQADDSESDAFQLEYRRALFQWATQSIRPEVLESTWRAFWLTAVDGRNPEKVAAELGMSVGAVYTAKCRVVARLREKVIESDVCEVFSLNDLVSTAEFPMSTERQANQREQSRNRRS